MILWNISANHKSIFTAFQLLNFECDESISENKIGYLSESATKVKL